ncbi:general amino acid permease [Metschnikowia bicuspidata]|uniref:General amino acid permease n=1 Tax=Metschnikowia bicuspidata TaxID=27322 RepID=A0A4P9ZHE5_9ASCO|nr:general amino acid permease [Metschnikowia bicuspidata]
MSRWQAFKDSFNPAEEVEIDNESLEIVKKANLRTAKSKLSKSLQQRHLQMIAVGGSIGTGLFVGTGSALASGGPAGIVIAWAVTASFVYTTMQSLGELSTAYPVSGGFNTYCTRFIEPSIGFAIGWNYVLQFLVLLPLELVAASISIQYWNDTLNPVIFVATFWAIIFFATMTGVKWFGEAEFVLCLIKIVAVTMFIILGIVLICGGGPTHQFIGATNWRIPGPFASGFKGVVSVFVTAAFSFGGTELVSLSAAEAADPGRAVPKAIKAVFFRIAVFYFGSIVIIATLVASNDPRLLNTGSSADAKASPFIIAIVNGGISVLPSIFNAVILIAVLSVGNISVYACSRSLNSLAEQGMAPKWTGYIDKKGRPLFALIFANVFGLISFVVATNKQNEMFAWLLAISGLSSIFTWMAINVCLLRFRAAMTAQNRSLNDLSFVSVGGIFGAWYSIVLCLLVILSTVWMAISPLHGSITASLFFKEVLGIPVIMGFAVYYKIWKRKWRWLIPSEDVDLDTGRLIPDAIIIAENNEERPWWKRILSHII